ncbi:hypothetical protein [Pseudodesulfovibrio nedwellii]|nr:hypothetical protein [Pseudodesulfovibrio nedwellii]
MNKIENTYERRHDDCMGLIGSPLASAGIQARNFTAAINEPEAGIDPGFYSTKSLAQDVERLCDPSETVTNARLLNVAVKYFFSYVHDAYDEPVPYGEVAGLYEQFSRHQSMNEPSDDIETMNRLRMWSSVLRVLADAPRAAHVMRGVLTQTDAPQCGGGPFVGVDLGAGTGIMLLALQIQARRNGFADIQTLGYQTDPVSGERTHDLVHSLGAGSVMLADPTREGAYGVVQGRNISYVANEVLAGIQQSLSAENCFRKYQAFFNAVGNNLDSAVFFPEGLIAYSAMAHASVILAKENRFQPPQEFMNEKFVPQGLIFEGKLLPMHKLGQDFYQFLT